VIASVVFVVVLHVLVNRFVRETQHEVARIAKTNGYRHVEEKDLLTLCEPGDPA
jgi:hypothetical protein